MKPVPPVQAVFRGSTVKVNIHVPIDSRQEKKQESQPQRNERKTYALVVEKKGMQFREILER
jgi:hypothetical protein